jgi:CheY-like chemotaxis protein
MILYIHMFWKKKPATDHKDKPHVLAIEDDPNNHSLYHTIFETVGFQVTIFSDADGDLVSRVLAVDPDIISMDLMIGKRDGLEAAALLKSDSRTTHYPIMILTNFTDADKMQRAKDIGATDYISLQAHPIKRVPLVFRTYVDNPETFEASNPFMRT